MKTKYTTINSIVSLIYYFLTIILGLVNRKVLVMIMGVEYQGINGLFSNILSMLSIAELGIGTAIIYHLYRPLELGEQEVVKSIMAFYKKCYNVIAVIVAAMGIIFIPFLPFVVKENTLPYSLWALYIWFLLDAVVSYLFTYKRSILIANQRNYVVIGCDILYQVVTKVGQIILLVTTHNFILYLAIMSICRFLENCLINYLAVRSYPYLRDKDISPMPQNIVDDIVLKVKGTVFHKIGSFIILGTDNILITKFFGLAVGGIMSNYQLIVNIIKNIVGQIMSSASASVGHMLVLEDDEKNYSVFRQMLLLNAYLSTCGVTGIICACTPLIATIFGKDLITDNLVMLAVSVSFYMTCMRQIFIVFKETAGILYEDRFIPIAESVINIVASLIMIKLVGLSGVFWGTAISSLLLFAYTYPKLVFKGVLKRNIKEYVFLMIRFVMIAGISIIGSNAIIHMIPIEGSLVQFVVYSIVSIIISTIVFALLYALWVPETKLLMKRFQKLLTKQKDS